MTGEYERWSQQVNATLAQLEARTQRLDAHGAELAKELLDVIERVDALDRALSERIERVSQRLESHLDALERRVDNHEGDHWRAGR